MSRRLIHPPGSVDRRDVFESNLRRLFARAYAPVEPRPEFVAQLTLRFVEACSQRRGDSPGSGRAPQRLAGRRHEWRVRDWRPGLVAAALLVIALGGAWALFGPGPGLPRTELARVRESRGASWRVLNAAEAARPLQLESDWLEVHAGGSGLMLVSEAARFTLEPGTEVVFERSAQRLQLLAGELGADLRGAAPWVLSTPAGALAPAGRASIRLVPRARFERVDAADGSWFTASARAALRQVDGDSLSSSAEALELDVGDVRELVALVEAPESVESASPVDAGQVDAGQAFSFRNRALVYRGRLAHRFPDDDRGARPETAFDYSADLDSTSGPDRLPVESPRAEPGGEQAQLAAQSPWAGIRGRVSDAETGSVISAFDVVVLEERSLPDPAFPERRHFEAPDGRFEWSGLRPGQYRVQVRAAGYAVGYVLGYRATAAEGRAIEELSVELERGVVVRGRVIDALSGEPLAGAEVLSEDEAAFSVLPMGVLGDMPELGARALTDVDGRFVLRNTTPTTRSLRADHADFGAAWGRLEDVGDELEIALPRPGAIEGYVTGSDGTALVEHRVVASFIGHLEPCLSFGSGLTDSEGAYRIEGLPPGSYALILAGPDEAAGPADFEARTAMVRVSSGRRLVHDFGSPRAGAASGPGGQAEVLVEGRVANPADEPFALGSISFVRLDEQGAGWEASFEGVTTDAQGGFSIGLEPGSYAVMTSRDAAHDLVWVGLVEPSVEDPGATLGLRFERSAGRFFGRVLGPAGEPASETLLLLEVLDDPGAERRASSGSFAGRAIVRHDGSFSLGGLAAGRYQAALLDPRGRLALTHIEFELDEQTLELERDIQLEAGRTLELEFQSPEAQPLADVRLRIVDDSGRQLDLNTSLRSTELGQLRVAGLPRGTFRLSARLPGFATARFDVTLLEEAQASRTIVLEPR